MALQIRRGTNVQRLLYTPLIGEMVFVTDYQTAGADPIYVGDGVTPGGVAVGQNAVLGGTVEGDINLNTHSITGNGTINTTGDISNLGNMQTRKITITGNGGVAVVSTGSITSTGDINVTGDVLVDGNVEALQVISDLHGSVVSDDGATILVNSDTKTFSGETIALAGGTSVSTLSGDGLIFENADPLVNFVYGSEAKPFAPTFYEQQPSRHYGKLVGTGNDVTFPGANLYLTYRGTLATPTTIQGGDRLHGTLVQSFNTASGSSPAFAGGMFWVAEDQAGAQAGEVPSTFVLGSGLNVAQAIFATRTETSNNNDALKYTSKGVLKVTSIDLKEFSNADRAAIQSSLGNGSIIYNYEPIDASDPQNHVPVGSPRLQILINSVWYNIPVSPAG